MEELGAIAHYSHFSFLLSSLHCTLLILPLSPSPSLSLCSLSISHSLRVLSIRPTRIVSSFLSSRRGIGSLSLNLSADQEILQKWPVIFSLSHWRSVRSASKR